MRYEEPRLFHIDKIFSWNKQRAMGFWIDTVSWCASVSVKSYSAHDFGYKSALISGRFLCLYLFSQIFGWQFIAFISLWKYNVTSSVLPQDRKHFSIDLFIKRVENNVFHLLCKCIQAVFDWRQPRWRFRSLIHVGLHHAKFHIIAPFWKCFEHCHVIFDQIRGRKIYHRGKCNSVNTTLLHQANGQL